MEDQIPQLSDRELLVRIDTKLDGVIEDKKDHEARLRKLEDQSQHLVTGQQLRVVEDQSQHFVTRKQLWVGLGGVFAAAGSAFPIVQWLSQHH